MSKPIDSLERKIRSRPGAVERIGARTDAARTVLRLAKLLPLGHVGRRDKTPPT